MNLQDFKAKNPAYKDVPDQKLADALHKKYYSSMPLTEFYQKVGVEPRTAQSVLDSQIPNPVYTDEMRPERGNMSFIDKMAKGASDIPAGVAQLAAHALPGVASNKIDEAIKRREFVYQDKRGEGGIDWGRMAGNIIAGLPVAGVGGAGIGAATVTGAALGAAQPVTDGDFWSEKGKQTAMGGAGGLVGGAVTRTASRLIYPRDEIATLTKAGVKPTFGQILGDMPSAVEQRLSSVPLLGDVISSARRGTIQEFNKAAYNRVLAPIGQKFKGRVGREGIEELGDTLSKSYQEVLPKLHFKGDQQFADEVNFIMNAVHDGMPEPQAALFEKHLRNKLFARLSTSGDMDGNTLKGVESEISRLAKGYRGDASFDQRQLGDALDSVLQSVRNALARSNPEHAARLQDINKAYAAFARVRDAAGRVGAQDGVFTPAQLQSAVRAADKSAGKGQFAKGKALMQDLSEAGKDVLGSTIPNSGTPERMLTGGAALGGLGYINPYAAGSALVSAAPYLPGARQLLATLLARRPAVARLPAQAVNRLVPASGAVAPAVAAQVEPTLR